MLFSPTIGTLKPLYKIQIKRGFHKSVCYLGHVNLLTAQAKGTIFWKPLKIVIACVLNFVL